MSIDVHTIGVGVETKEVTTATRELDKFGKSADTASRKADNLGASSKRTAKDVDALQSSSSGAVASLGRMAAGISAIAVAGSLIRTIDEYTKFTAQLKLATRSQQEYNAALSDVTRIANTAQVSLSSIGTLYARLNNALREVGVSQTQVAKITENVGLALKISGATAAEASSAMLQLSQAFGSGVLRGEEFNAVNEAAPALMRALAESIGVPIGQLRQLASDGKITSDVLAKAFGDDKLLETYRKQAKEIGTIGGSVQVLKNELSSLVNFIDKDAGGFSTWVKNSFGSLAEYLKAIQLVMKDGTTFENIRFFTIGNLSERLTKKLRAPESGTSGSSVGGSGAITGGNIIPGILSSSNTPRAVQNIDEIHRKQDEAARKSKEYQEQIDKVTTDRKLRAIEQEYDARATKMANHLDAIAKQVDIEEAADKEKQERLKVYMEYQQNLANENFKEAQSANKKLEDARLKEFEKTTDAINNIFREGFAGLVNGGTSTWKAFTKSLATTFKTTVADQIYKLFAQPFVVKLVASVLGLGVSGGASASSLVASGGGSGSVGNIFSGLKDIISAGNGSIVSSIESLGTFLSTGTGGLGDTLGGFIGQYSAQIANVLPYAGAFMKLLSGDVKGAAATAVGTAIGSIWGPIGGAIGGALGSLVGGMFGEHVSRPKYYANTSISSSGAYNTGAFGNSDSKGTGGGVAINNGDAVGNAIIALTKSIGGTIDQSFILGTAYSQKYNNYNYNLGSSTRAGQKYADYTLADVKNNQTDMSNAVGYLFLESIKKGFVDVPEYLQEIVKRSSYDRSNALDQTNNLGSLKSLYEALNDLPPVFDAIRWSVENTTTLNSLDTLKEQLSNLRTYTNLFYTEAENFDTFTKQLTTQLGTLNETLPTSRDEYRALIDTFEVVDLATQAQFDFLVALAPAMDEYFKQLQAQKDIVEQTTGSLRDLNSFTSLAEYRQYKGVSANYGATLALDNTANYRSGNLSNNLSGQGVVTGDKSADVVLLLKELRDYMKQNVIAATNSADLLDRFDRAGMPARA